MLFILILSISIVIGIEGCHPADEQERQTSTDNSSRKDRSTKNDNNSIHLSDDNHLTIVYKVTSGTHKSYVLTDNKNTLYFWKEAPNQRKLLGEIAGSEMANYVTHGLVPVAKAMALKKDGTSLLGSIQPYIAMEPGAFASINYENDHFDPKKLTDLQKQQLFVHMIADRLIANYDTHTSQFGIANGNIIGFDKGHAFQYFKSDNITHLSGLPSKEEPITFNPEAYWIPLGSDRPVYTEFAKYLKDSPIVLRQILDSQTVQDALVRCEQLTKEQIQQWLQPYVVARFNDNNNEQQFIEQVYQRAQTIKDEVESYFSMVH